MTEAAEQPNVRPALETLKRDQMTLLTGGDDLPSLRDGFESRQEAIEWFQAASVRTFGFMADEFDAINLCRDTTLLQALIVDPEIRARWCYSEKPLGLEAASGHRRWIETQLLAPAGNRAYNQLRKMAGEYIDDEEQEVGHFDPEEQDHVAMRPGFQQKDQQQRVALRELWAGFADEEALRDWIHYLDEPTNGAVDPDLPRKIVVDDVAQKHLIDAGDADPPEARLYRERLAITKLLPAFTSGIKRMDAGELAKRSRTSNMEVAQG